MAETDPRVAEARREVLAARGALVDEIGALERSARSTFDVRGKAAKSPEKAAAAAAGAAFLVLGGPGRILGGAKRAIFGRGKPYPSKLLPEEVDAVVRRLGDDGEKVRGVLEREFAAYLKDKKKKDKSSVRSFLVGSLLMPAASAAVKNAAKRAVEGTAPAPKPEGKGSKKR